MNKPSIAFVLGAGLGERLRPMTLSTPKPLIPIWNRPLLAHTLDALVSWGVKEVYINTHWLHEVMHDYIASYDGPLTLHELYEPQILGTGGALRNLSEHLHGEPFWMINGDVVFDLDPEPLLTAFEKSGEFASTWLDPKRGPRTVEMDYAQRITNYHSPTPAVEHTYTFSGVSLLSPSVISYLPKDKAFCSLIDAFDAAMYDGHFVQGVMSTAANYWNDAGTLASYLQVHRDVRKEPSLARYAADATAKPCALVKTALAALKWSAGETIQIPLGQRGSKRTFWRLISGRRSVIAIGYEVAGRAENAKYAAIAKALLKAGCPVPKIVVDDTKHNLLIMEDFGDATLDKVKLEPSYTFEDEHECEDEHCSCHSHEHDHDAAPMVHYPLIEAVMQMLAKFHATRVDLPLEPCFDAKLYAWEQELYTSHVEPFPADVKAELEKVVAQLLAEPLVLVHRDFQSTNILVVNDKPCVIDFQGMRMGPAVYDLASFLYDPYVSWTPEVVEGALAAYAKAAQLDLAHLQALLPLAGIQRLIQATGAYYRLASVGQPRFMQYVPVARQRIATLAAQAQLPALASYFSKA